MHPGRAGILGAQASCLPIPYLPIPYLPIPYLLPACLF